MYFIIADEAGGSSFKLLGENFAKVVGGHGERGLTAPHWRGKVAHKLHVNGDECCSDCWPEYSVLVLLGVPPKSETNKPELQYLRKQLGNLILSQVLGPTFPCCWEK